MEQKIGSEYWPFAFGCTADQIAKMKADQSYCPKTIYDANPKIKKALDALRDHTFARTEEEHQVFSDLYHKLLETHYGGPPDRYFTIKDLESYYDTQLKVEALYRDPRKWAFYAMHNMAGMGDFSIDHSAQGYADLVWGVRSLPIDREVLEKVRYDYTAPDCR